MRSVHEIAELDPPHRWVGRVTERPPRFEFAMYYEPVGHATSVTLVLVAELPGGPVSRLVEPLVRRQLGRRLRGDLRRLKTVVEPES